MQRVWNVTVGFVPLKRPSNLSCKIFDQKQFYYEIDSFFEKRVGGNEFTPTTIYPPFPHITKFENNFLN